MNIGLQGRFAEWAGDVLPPDRDIVLVGDPALAAEAKVRLARVGLDRVVGQLADPPRCSPPGRSWSRAAPGSPSSSWPSCAAWNQTCSWSTSAAPPRRRAGRCPGRSRSPWPSWPTRWTRSTAICPVVAYCASGYRSQVAASVLAAAGFADVSDLLGGYGAWEGAGLPVAHGRGPQAAARTPQVSARAAQVAARRRRRAPRRSRARRVAKRARARAILIPMGEVQARRHELPQATAHRRGLPVRWPLGRGHRRAARLGLRRGQPRRRHVRLGGRRLAGRHRGRRDPPPRDACRQALEQGMVVHRADPLNCETSIPALIGGVVMPNARFYVRNHFPTPRPSTRRPGDSRSTGWSSGRCTLSLRELPACRRRPSSSPSSAPATAALP